MKRSDDCLDPLPYYKWHWQRYRANRTVQRMPILERGIYRELLDEQWEQGCIAGDDESLAEILGDSEQVLASAKQVLSKCFTEISPGVWQNETLEEQRTEKDTIRANRKVSGRLGGLAKKYSEANAKQVLASATDAEANASKCHIEEKRREEERSTETPPLVDATPTPKTSLLNTEDFDDQIIARAIQEDHNLIGPYVLGDVTKAVKNIRTKQGIKGDAIRQAFNQRWENYKKSGGTCELAGWMKNGLYITTDKPKTKVLSPAERTRQSIEEWEREKEEKRLQAPQRAN